jgi:cysteine dioxygenase
MKTERATLELLTAELDAALADKGGGARVAQLLEDYCASRSDDWRRFALFEADYYARNLIHRSELYELIVLCWSEGQKSPIHDHAAQRCWMGVLEGTVRESLYRFDAARAALTPGAAREFEAGRVAFITDEVGWHSIEPARGAAVTLHLYSHPIRECRVLDEASGRIANKRMRYHSVGGVVQPSA